MTEYVLDHHLDGERARLALMSELLDPMNRRYLEPYSPGPRRTQVPSVTLFVSPWVMPAALTIYLFCSVYLFGTGAKAPELLSRQRETPRRL